MPKGSGPSVGVIQRTEVGMELKGCLRGGERLSGSSRSSSVPGKGRDERGRLPEGSGPNVEVIQCTGVAMGLRGA